MSWFVFVGSWLLGPHANPSPWLDAEAEKMQDPDTGGRALGKEGDWEGLFWGLGGVNTPFLSQAICAVLSSFELPKKASLEQT